MKSTDGNHYQIRNVPTSLRKAVRVAAALKGMGISEYVKKVLGDAVKKDGVQIEEGD